MSDWQTAITQAAAALDATFGIQTTIGADAAIPVRFSNRSAQTVETETGHLRIATALAVVRRANRATLIARGTTMTEADGTQWTVRGLTSSNAATRTYELYRKE